jgi:hypothetical protein
MHRAIKSPSQLPLPARRIWALGLARHVFGDDVVEEARVRAKALPRPLTYAAVDRAFVHRIGSVQSDGERVVMAIELRATAAELDAIRLPEPWREVVMDVLGVEECTT